MNGFINIIKPANMSSALAVMLVKKKIRAQFGKQSVGHMGTLDPMAEGVLPMGINQANRLFNYLLDKEKTYLAEFTFGYETDTIDITGETLSTTDNIPLKSQIDEVLHEFIGEIEQIPPKYSAKNIDGKRGYELARSGVEFELKPSIVTVIDFKCVRQVNEKTFEFLIKCKGGTYIRSLCRDLADKLSTKAVMSALNRLSAGVFSQENAVTYEDFAKAEDISKYIIKADAVINFDKIILTENQAKKILNGVFDSEYEYSDGLYRVYNGDVFWGVGEVSEKTLKIKSYVRDL
ncbi:MAG: tRNA pseudouridine(55) synthase TruB [Clostridia bacterium]|nr:tRNA pseudouridine(55) synthase TruB [Clostridia bacterium]